MWVECVFGDPLQQKCLGLALVNVFKKQMMACCWWQDSNLSLRVREWGTKHFYDCTRAQLVFFNFLFNLKPISNEKQPSSSSSPSTQKNSYNNFCYSNGNITRNRFQTYTYTIKKKEREHFLAFVANLKTQGYPTVE